MAHHITAIVTSPAGASALARPTVELSAALVIIPLTHELVDALDYRTTAVLDGWELVTPSLIERLRALIAGPFAVIETEYFGGTGCQRAGAWSGATTLVEPHEDDNAVNAALAALGVTASTSRDEWDAVGLTRFRSNDALIENAS